MKQQIAFCFSEAQAEFLSPDNVLAVVERRGYDLKKFGITREEVSYPWPCEGSMSEQTHG
ncbi:MAG: hypothetical protein WBQ43_23075 [Terriglobales bacterium]